MLTRDQAAAAVDAFLSLLMTRSYGSLSPREVAEAADVPLAGLLVAFPGKPELLAAFADRIDEAVLAEDDPAMAEEPARERLFDVMMRRYDALLPHKLALIQLERDARRDPVLGLVLAQAATRAMRRMAAAADVALDGPRGALVLAGLIGLHARVLRVWLSEEDAGQARTMAELDKALRQAERRIGDLDRLMGMVPGASGGNPFDRLRARFDRRPADPVPGAEGEQQADAA